jgi:hypothetical protein
MAGMDFVLFAYPLVFSAGCVVAAYVAANRHPKLKARRNR